MPTPLIERYRRYLPVNDDTPVISLFEGDTPLIRLTNIMHDEFADKITVYAKFDGMNPTGSFKDRGMTMAVSKAAETGSRAVVCASTGNTSASAAAYAARAGMQAFVLIPQGKVALGKLAQAMMFGARVVQIDGNFDDGMQLVKQLSDALPLTLVNSVNPYRLHGQKTAAFEIVDTLGVAPDYHFLPVGNAGNISAYWMGYNEYHDDGIIDRKPVMVGYQASGAAPLVHGAAVQQPETVATAIRIGNPQSWQLAVTAAEESNGWFAALDDDDILSAQRLLAARDGVFCEPASAIALAGLRHEFARGVIPDGATVVCTLTGNGMKDPDTAIKQCGNDALLQCAAEESAISALVTPYLRRH